MAQRLRALHEIRLFRSGRGRHAPRRSVGRNSQRRRLLRRVHLRADGRGQIGCAARRHVRRDERQQHRRQPRRVRHLEHRRIPANDDVAIRGVRGHRPRHVRVPDGVERILDQPLAPERARTVDESRGSECEPSHHGRSSSAAPTARSPTTPASEREPSRSARRVSTTPKSPTLFSGLRTASLAR